MLLPFSEHLLSSFFLLLAAAAVCPSHLAVNASFFLTSLLCDVSSPADQINIRAESGETVILPCRAPENQTVTSAEWRRTDLESGQPVHLYRKEKLDEETQSPSFRNRTDLQDVENGDVSLVLQKVTTADTGTYECPSRGCGSLRRDVCRLISWS
uniref:Ig-like domain-containing protein n=1 Tax=Fundulus heteroclitus TaxID=8078 RepID=A0A3Q2TWV2_FUNHE